MNELSSKFVDQFALEKMLQEKLTKVHHSPLKSYFKSDQSSLDDFVAVRTDSTNLALDRDEGSYRLITLPSSLPTEAYPENNEIYLHYHPVPEANGNILWVHGLYDDNIQNYNYIIQLLNESAFNVYIFILPFHFERKPSASLYSGEYYWSADLFRSQYAAKQAIFDLKTAVGFIRNISPLPTVIAGFSMGGNVSLRYFLMEDRADGLFLINPVTRLSQLIWESPLLRSVRGDLESAGYDLHQVEQLFQRLDPVKNIHYPPLRKPVALGYSVYDQIVGHAMYLEFVQKFRFETTIAYNAGHLNILRVPKLANDIGQYFDSVVEGAFRQKCEG
ncbi:MAG TPA: alpha/beta fold hydrolase [Bacillota bacterium]|nr:alpha/beta fold hydrolase [Bacillota bacterium]